VTDPSEWSPADGLTLEPNALKTVTLAAGNVALTAGPGAGKTELLAQRADFLLRTGLCRYPKRILAISFKVDASANLKDRVKRRCGPILSSRFDSHTFHAFAKRIIDRFRPVLTGVNELDHDYTIGPVRIERKQITFLELVPLAVQILESSPIALNAVRQTYTDVFLDEFQDCTNPQYALLRLCFCDTPIRAVAVGDTKQKIMGFAGALDGVFATYAQNFNANKLSLYRNFRSAPLLLRMQNDVIRVMDPTAVMPPELVAGDGGIVQTFAFETDSSEAESIVDNIRMWCKSDGVPPNEIALLVRDRASFYTEKLTAELTKNGIAFRSEQDLQDLSTEPASQLLTDYLLVIFGTREPEAYLRLMDVLTGGVVDEDEESDLRENWRSYIQSDITKRNSLASPTMTEIWEFAKRFLAEVGKERIVSLSAEYESEVRMKDILRETKKRLTDLFKDHGDIVRALSLFTYDASAVRILTIHKSKGLEFNTIVMVGVEAEAFWGKNKEEERNVFFVGISRAKKRLVLTHCANRETPSNYTGKWIVSRNPHDEFLGYAQAFCS